MKQLLIPAMALLLLASCKNKKNEKIAEKEPEKKIMTDSTLVTDSSWGAITRNTDFEGLKKIFGADSLKDERVCGPECADSIDVTFIYRGSTREICVYWKDSAYHKKIGMLESWNPESPYHTAGGLRMGSTMTEMLKLNGQKITFSGFGWDYGGMIQSFNGGKLDKGSVTYHLDLSDYTDNSLSGDTTLDTDMPAVKKMLDKITVSLLGLSFYP